MAKPKKKAVKMEEWNPNQENPQPQTNRTVEPVIHQDPVKAAIQHKQEAEANAPGFFVIDDLPTKGRFYPEGTVIKARCMKVIEVKMLSQMTEDNANDLINDVVRRCIRGIDIEDLYIADKLYLVFWLRANTYKDSGHQMDFTCPKCSKKSTYSFELDVLRIQDYEREEYEKFTSETTLPSGQKLSFRLLTVADENANEKFLKDNGGGMMDFDAEIVSICRMIDTINGANMGMIAKYNFIIDELAPTDFSYIESFIADHGIGIEPMIDVKCDKCGGASTTMLPFRPDFFLPKVRT